LELNDDIADSPSVRQVLSLFQRLLKTCFGNIKARLDNKTLRRLLEQIDKTKYAIGR
jgi:hypothetical protein